MIRSLLKLLVVCALCAPAFATVQVNATLLDAQGNPLQFAYLKFDLDYCGFNIPQVPSQPFSIVSKSIQFTPAQLPATLYANNEISCGNSYSTLWKVTAYLDDNTPILGNYDYDLCSSTTNCAAGVATLAWNLSSAQPFDVLPGSPPPPGFQTIFGNPTQSQVVHQPGSGSGASAQVVCCTGGAVTQLNLTAGGSGYQSAPILVFTAGGCSTEPTGTAQITAQAVSAVNLTSGGAGCTSPPSLAFQGGGTSLAIVGTLDLSRAYVLGLTCFFTGCGGNGGGGSSAAPPAGAVQFYASGILAGSPNLTWNNALNQLSVGPTSTSNAGIACNSDPLSLSNGDCLVLGALAASGTSINSQSLAFNYLDSGGSSQSSSVFVDSTGKLNIPSVLASVASIGVGAATTSMAVPTVSTGDTSTKAANTQWVRNQGFATSTAAGGIGANASAQTHSTATTSPQVFTTLGTAGAGVFNSFTKTFHFRSLWELNSTQNAGVTATVGLCLHSAPTAVDVAFAIGAPTPNIFMIDADCTTGGTGASGFFTCSYWGITRQNAGVTLNTLLTPIISTPPVDLTGAVPFTPCVQFSTASSSNSITFYQGDVEQTF